ncbi:MAG: hypothetical protein Q9162_000200 [Coniocarpon cinnabarinum]
MAGTRYVRYILLSAICLLVVFFISSSRSSNGSSLGTDTVKSQYNHLKNAWANPAKPPGSPFQNSEKEKPLQLEHTEGDQSEEKFEESESSKADKASSDESPYTEEGSAKGEKESDKSDKSSHGKSSKTGNKNKTPSKKPAQDKDSAKTPNKGSLGGAKSSAPKQNATFVTLARNSDIWEISKSIRQVEDRFNHRYNYDWVFLNDKEFDDDFKRITTNLVSGKTRYGMIAEEHWSFPEWIDQDKAAEVRKDMSERKIIYGDSISYRHMCRYESGFFFRHPLMHEYEWYWRVEPSIELYCDVDYDPFKFMADNDKKYSFVLSLYEYKETIPTIWDSVRTFMKEHPEHLAKNNALDFLSDDGGKTYNNCHFWSNFEIGNLDWLRSDAYVDFFDQLDHDGGFFYERWGDAPVHSIGAGLTLPRDQIHFFDDIAYYHVPFTHCPTDEQVRLDRKCSCNPKDNFDWQGYSCTSRWFDINSMKKPKGYEDQQS